MGLTCSDEIGHIQGDMAVDGSYMFKGSSF